MIDFDDGGPNPGISAQLALTYVVESTVDVAWTARLLKVEQGCLITKLRQQPI